MVLNYLQSRGFQPTTENVRRALEANARDPGVIPGLRSDTAATDAEDQAAMKAAGVGGGKPQGGSGAGGKPTPDGPPMVNLGAGPTNEAAWSPDTSAQPTQDAGAGSSLGLAALLGLPAAGLMYGASKIPPRPMPGEAAPPMPDVGAGGPPSPGEIDYTMLPPGGAGEVSPMEAALNRATSPDASPIRPPIDPTVMPARPGISTMQPGGPTSSTGVTTPPPREMPPLPFNSATPHVTAPMARRPPVRFRVRA
jgi:hypothetical protein